MEQHNVTLINFPNGQQQIRIYKKPVLSGYIRDNPQRKKKYGYVPWDDRIAEDITDRYSEHSIKRSQGRTKQKIYELARSNKWEYFITLTFNGKAVNRYDYNEVTTQLTKWINNLKKVSAPKLKYLIVPELHKDGAYHFHGLISDVGKISFYDSGIKDKKGKTIYNILNYYLGYSTATKVQSSERVSAYITKYITKELASVTVEKKRYWHSLNLEKAERIDYIMTEEQKKQMIDSIDITIKHKKELKIPLTGQRIKYIEVSYDEI